MNMKNESILIVGCGYMAEEYLKVIKAIGNKAIIVGRGIERVNKLKSSFPEFQFYSGGLEYYLDNFSDIPHLAINTVNVEYLYSTTLLLINAGIKKVLLEKPGALTIEELTKISNEGRDKDAELFIAYNRRFYSSVLELEKQVELDGGILSANFEFTEWIHTIDSTQYDINTLSRWVIANSSHVIDTFFYLIGMPESLECRVYGGHQISWHASGSIFMGLGISNKNIPFTYHSNWLSPGRWSIEILTRKRRFYLRPMEALNMQRIGSIALEPLYTDDLLDKRFKPGLYLETISFLGDPELSRLCTIQKQLINLQLCQKIAAYESK